MDNDRDESPLDLSALAHDSDPAAHDRAIGAILREVEAELARRRVAGTAIGQVARWWRPILPLAAVLTLAAAGVLTQVTPAETSTDSTTPAFSQWLGVPTPVSSWLETDLSPSPAQVFKAFEEDQ